MIRQGNYVENMECSRVILSKTFPKCEQKTEHDCADVKMAELRSACLYN